jgi:ABC-type multidrug transport system fused ATPase/permease subunit
LSILSGRKEKDEGEIFIFFRGFLGGFRIGVFAICVSRLNIRLRTKLFQSYLRQEIGFFDTHESGKLLSRLNQDTQIMSSTVANNIAQCIGALVKFGKFEEKKRSME